MKLEFIIDEGYVKPPLPEGIEWRDALKSGKYKKGIGQLCYKDSEGVKRYCCLGVKAELQGRLKLSGIGYADDESGGYLDKGNPFTSILGSSQGRFPDGFCVKGDKHQYNSLAEINDRCNSFEPVIEALEAAWDLQ